MLVRNSGLVTATLLAALAAACSLHLEQRDMPAQLRSGYNNALFHRHNDTFRTGAAIHYAHGRAHDVLQLSALSNARQVDAQTDADFVQTLRNRMRMEPTQMLYGPHSGQGIWRLYLTIDWTHHHHEQTYDILADPDVEWADKERLTRRALDYYLARSEHARSTAPLELTMRRAGVMMKPYFGYFRNNYPRTNNFFYAAHWWHPSVYEAQMIAGNDREQEAAVAAVQKTLQTVLSDRPQRMLLSREVMPRYSRMTPESANVFDNLHMLHGIAYDILAYEGWSIDEKRAELYRVIEAMSEQPGDRRLARAFEIPQPTVDPRRYEPWMKTVEGAMNEIMSEMMKEMWPMMSPDGAAEAPPEVQAQMKLKLTPGTQPGEIPGSLHDAVMKLVPGMKMDPEGQKPGKSPNMTKKMADNWTAKARAMPPLPPWPMQAEPSLASVPPAKGSP
jgi:hypothetical protein